MSIWFLNLWKCLMYDKWWMVCNGYQDMVSLGNDVEIV